jgi:predicted nucleic acid-binding Zn finger protein
MEEIIVLERVLMEVKNNHELSHSNWERLRSVFGERFDRAWRAIQEKRIKKYTFKPSDRVIWIVVGQGGEYQVLPSAGYCGCDDFYFRVIDSETAICYHLLGQKIASALRSYDAVEEDDEVYHLLTKEWRNQILNEEV